MNDTAADCRDVMVEGPDGLLSICPPWNKPKYTPTNRRVTWPNGGVAITYAAEAPELLRGPQHDGAWADEPAKWKNLKKTDDKGGTAWDNLMLGLRMGEHPQCVATTTPRAIPLIRELRKQPGVIVTTGSSFENQANLTDQWFDEIRRKYEGTRLGRQELYAELLDDVAGALWNRTQIDNLRIQKDALPALKRIVISLDPAVSQGEESNETGIVACGVGMNGHGYLLSDESGKYSPDGWGRKAVNLLRQHQGDRIIAEVNNGGDMVGYTIKTVDKHAPYKSVHASRGKRTRAEPVAALYEQGKVHHVGSFPELEDQLCTWDASTNEDSPDRLDALVWAFTELMLEERDVVATVQANNAYARGRR